MIVKIIKNLENKMEKLQESISKDLEELKNKHTETNNTITEIKNTLKGQQQRGGKDGGGIGQQDHFLPHKFLKRTFQRRANSTKQLL